ncbi:hypothetical protein PFBG_00507, partial [Plasmodium falciparum 7G8]
VINTHKKPSIRPRHIQTTRLLCECELFAPQNYDNDPEIKTVMQQFHDRTTQRFQEYDEKLQEKRQIYKDKCDKEIQKIILKDKLEKELTEKFAILQTDIHSDAIPTCICEKSIADKVEKGCLRCGGVFGGGIAPSVGILGGIGQVALSAWKTAAITSAKETAEKAAIAKATNAGVDAVILELKNFVNGLTGMTVDLTPIVTPSNYNCGSVLYASAKKLASKSCIVNGQVIQNRFCDNVVYYPNESGFNLFAQAGITKYETEFASQKALLEAAELDAVDSKYAFWQTANIAPVVAILVIVLIMVIIYLILRYRRKKKMKKKLQYIKLLEE